MGIVPLISAVLPRHIQPDGQLADQTASERHAGQVHCLLGSFFASLRCSRGIVNLPAGELEGGAGVLGPIEGVGLDAAQAAGAPVLQRLQHMMRYIQLSREW